MAELQDRWEAISESDTATVAQEIIGSSNPNAAYLEAIQGKTADEILALQISIYAYHPEGNAANINTWRTATMADFETFRDNNPAFASITAAAAPAPEAVLPEGVSVGDNTITIATDDGHTVEIEYRFTEDAFRESEYGFRIKVDGEIINSDRVGVGANASIAIAAISEHRDAIIGAMTPILQERFRMTDSGDNDVVNRGDLDNVFDGIRTSLGNVDGTMLEIVDALTTIAVRDAVNGLGRIDEDARREFLEGSEYTSALAVAEEVLAQERVAISAEPAEPVILADTRYDFITKFDIAEIDAADEAHDENAVPQDRLNTLYFEQFSSGAFTEELTEIELEAVALANVLFEAGADGRPGRDPATQALTLDEARAHPDYIAVMEAYAAFSAEARLTVTAGADENALTITANGLDTPEAVTAYIEANRDAVMAQIEDVLNGDDTEITVDEATAALTKIDAQLEGATEGGVDHTVLSMAKARAEEVIAGVEAAADADVDTDVVVDAQIEGRDGGNASIREIQLYAAMAQAGGLASLEGQTLSSIDGRAGRLTGNSMVKMMGMSAAELNALGSSAAAAEHLDQMMNSDEAFRQAVFNGLKARVESDPEDVREFLQHQGVEIADDVTGAALLAKVEEYEALYGSEPAAEASITISAPADPANAFDMTITGISTVDQLQTYLATEGNTEALDEQLRSAMYNDITVVDISDGVSADEAAVVNGWIDAQLATEGLSEVETALLERAKGLVEADVAATAEAEITVRAHSARADDDRVLDGNIITEAQEALNRNVERGDVIPDAGILTIIEGGPMLVRQIEGELVVTQIHEDNFASVLSEGVVLDTELEGKLRERADMGDTEVRFSGVTIGVDPSTADLQDTSTISITKDRKDGLVNTLVSDSSGAGVLIESEELADAIDHFDGRAPRDERFVTNYDLPGTFDSAAIARGLDALERAIDNNGAGSLSVEFIEGANGTTAEINYGDGQKLEIPKGLYDAIMERAGTEATRDNSHVVEISAPGVGA